MRKVRDQTILEWQMILDGRMKGTDAEMVRRTLEDLTSSQQDIVRSKITKVVYTALHNLLWGLEQEDGLNICCVEEDGSHVNLSTVSDGLAGELYSEHGWIARFSEIDEKGQGLLGPAVQIACGALIREAQSAFAVCPISDDGWGSSHDSRL